MGSYFSIAMYNKFLDSKVTVFLADQVVSGELVEESSKYLLLYVVDDVDESLTECIINKKQVLCITREIKKPTKFKSPTS